MKLNRKWLLLVALVLSVAMATTGTLAYLTDEDKDVNTMTLGKVEIVQNEQERTDHGLDEFTQDKPLYPAVYAGEAPTASIPWADESKWPNPNEAWKVVEDNANVVDKFVTVTNIGKSDAYVRTIIAYEGDPINGTDIHIVQNSVTSSNAEVAGEFAATEYIENVMLDGVRYDVIVYTYKAPLKPDETTIPSLKQIYMDKGCDNEDVEAYGEKYDVLVLSQAIQVNGFEEMGPVAALNDGFGAVNATNLAKWLAETEIGSPNGDKNDTNNPPLILPETSWENNASDRNFAAEETIEIGTAEDLAAFAKAVNDDNQSFSGKTVKLTADIDLKNHLWTPIGQTGHITFNGVFDGQNYTIKNLYVVSDDQTGAHYSSGLFGWVESHSADHGHIKNVKIDGAYVSGHHNCGALVGCITQQTALVENCHVKNAQIICTYANGDADGDKAGALIGNATVATPVKDCTAKSSTVSAGRDAGAVAGAGNEANFTGCSFENVTVTSNGTGSGANIREETIGRLLK